MHARYVAEALLAPNLDDDLHNWYFNIAKWDALTNEIGWGCKYSEFKKVIIRKSAQISVHIIRLKIWKNALPPNSQLRKNKWFILFIFPKNRLLSNVDYSVAASAVCETDVSRQMAAVNTAAVNPLLDERAGATFLAETLANAGITGARSPPIVYFLEQQKMK